MSTEACQIFAARAVSEEGVRLLPYDDSTGHPVVAPVGNLSWGVGFNLMKCGSPGLFNVMIAYLAGALDAALSVNAWYSSADTVRQSVFLDIAFNGGLSGLINGYPHMIAAARSGNWTEAAAQCTVADARLNESRYAPLRSLLINGVST